MKCDFDNESFFRSPPPSQPIDEWSPPNLPTEASIRIALEDPTTPISTLLRNQSFLLEFRERNSALMARILDETTVCEVIRIFQTTDQHDLILIIFQLFLSANPALLQKVAQSAEFIDIITQIFSNNFLWITDNSRLLFIRGLTTQILMRALMTSPSETIKSMLQSEIFFELILKNLHEESIYQLALQIVQIPPSNNHSYLWGYLAALIHQRILMPEKPSNWDLSIPCVKACSVVELNSEQKVHIIFLFTTYLRTYEHKEFRDSLISIFSFFISTLFDSQEKIALFELGKYLPSNNKLIDIALDTIDDKYINTELTQKALEYLTIFYEGKNIVPIMNFLFRALNPENQTVYGPNNLILLATKDLVSRMMEKAPYPRFLAKIAQHCIAQSWNSNDCSSGRLMFRSFCLAISTIVGDMPSWDGWKVFQKENVNNFRCNGRISLQRVKIDVKNWDKELINKLLTHSSNIEMSVDDQRPIYEELLNCDEDESLSAESGSYMGNMSDVSDSDYEQTQPQQKLDVDPSPLVQPEFFSPGDVLYPQELIHSRKRAMSMQIKKSDVINHNTQPKRSKDDTDDKKCKIS